MSEWLNQSVGTVGLFCQHLAIIMRRVWYTYIRNDKDYAGDFAHLSESLQYMFQMCSSSKINSENLDTLHAARIRSPDFGSQTSASKLRPPDSSPRTSASRLQHPYFSIQTSASRLQHPYFSPRTSASRLQPQDFSIQTPAPGLQPPNFGR